MATFTWTATTPGGTTAWETTADWLGTASAHPVAADFTTAPGDDYLVNSANLFTINNIGAGGTATPDIANSLTVSDVQAQLLFAEGGALDIATTLSLSGLLNLGLLNLGTGGSVLSMGSSGAAGGTITLSSFSRIEGGFGDSIQNLGTSPTEISGSGTILVPAGDGIFNIGTGVQIASTGAVNMTFSISPHATLSFADAVGGGTVVFSANSGSGVLDVGDLSSFNPTGIKNLNVGVGANTETTVIDFINAGTNATATLSNQSTTGATLNVFANGTSHAIPLIGNFTTVPGEPGKFVNVNYLSDGISGTDIFLTDAPPTITISSGTTSVSSPIPNTTAYVVEDSGTLDILSGGVVSGVITISSGGQVVVSSGGEAFDAVVFGGGTLTVASGGTASGVTVGSGGVVEVFNGGSLVGSDVNNGTVDFDLTASAGFSGTMTGSGDLVLSGGGDLDVVSSYTGAAQIDDTSTLEFSSTYVGAATFSGSPTGFGGTLKLDVPSTGPITVVNSNDTVIAQPGGSNWINAAVSYTLPSNVDALFLYAGAQGTGNSDASGDALYALDGGHAQTLTGNSANDTFVVYNSSDVVAPKAGSHDVVYAAASYTLPTGVDTLILQGTATQGVGNSDAAGDGLYAANPAQVATLTGNSPNDTFVVYNSSDVVVPKAGSHDVVYSAVNYTLPTGVDILILEASASQGVGNSDAAGDALYAANPGQVATLTGNSPNDTFVVYNSADVVVPKAGSHDIVYSAVNYTLPTGVDQLILEAGTQAVGNSDAAGDTLYAANAGIAQTLTGHSHNDTFVVYNSADTVIGQASSTDTVYAAANFTLPTNVDTLFLESNASHGTGNSDAADTLIGNGGVASTLVAGSGADLLVVAGTAGTIMTGGAGHDTFAFPNVMGKDEVTNFGLAKDTLQFNATLFANFTAAMNHASQSGANTVFTIDANDTVTLDNVTKTSLTAGNFHFN